MSRGGNAGRPADEHPRRCGAQSKRTKEQCKAWAVRGTDPPRCKNHAGKSRAELAEQRERHDVKVKAELAIQRIRGRLGVDVDPTEHLLDTLHTAAQQQHVFELMVADLDNAGEAACNDLPGLIRGTSSDPLLARNSAGTVTVHPFVTLWTDAVERRAKLAKLAIDADVAGRVLALHESTAAFIDEAMSRALQAAGIDHAAQLTVRHALDRELAAGAVVDVDEVDP